MQELSFYEWANFVVRDDDEDTIDDRRNSSNTLTETSNMDIIIH